MVGRHWWWVWGGRGLEGGGVVGLKKVDIVALLFFHAEKGRWSRFVVGQSWEEVAVRLLVFSVRDLKIHSRNSFSPN